MKFLYLLGSRLSLYFQKSRLMFLLFCFCGVATSLSFLFFYAQLPSVKNRESNDAVYREFLVTDYLSGLSMDSLKELQDDPMVNCVTVIHVGAEGRVGAGLDKNPTFNALMGTGSFEGAEPYSVLAPHSPADPNEKRVGETMTIGGKDFKVIGTITGGADQVYIPLETYLGMGFSTEIAVVEAVEKSDADSGALEAKLKKVLGGDIKIGETTKVKEYDEDFSKEIFKSLCVTYVVVILVFLFLFLQMVEETGRETAICRTFGATGVKIVLLHFCEIMLLTGLSVFSGCLLHAVLYKPVISKLHSMKIPYYFGDYVIIFAVIIGVTLVASIPYVIRCLFLSPKEATLTAAK